MPHSYYQAFRRFYKAPPLSAIVHGSNPTSFGDGICLPSTCHSRTWLLDNYQDTHNETSSSQLTSCEQDHFTEDAFVQSSCLPSVVQRTYSNSKPSESTSCQSGSSSTVSENVSRSCQSRSSQQVGFGIQRTQPESYMAKCCPLKSSVSQSCQTLEYESNQCRCQISESSSCSPRVSAAPGPQLLESYEPACCITGGLKSSSK